MKTDEATHVQPLVLWQCACGGLDLAKRDFQHVIACTQCETLAVEIWNALDDLHKSLRLSRPCTS